MLMMRYVVLVHAAIVLTLADRTSENEAPAHDEVSLVSAAQGPLAYSHSNALHSGDLTQHYHHHLHGHASPGTSTIVLTASHRASLLSPPLQPDNQETKDSGGTRHEPSLLLSANDGGKLVLELATHIGGAETHPASVTKVQQKKSHIVTPVQPASVGGSLGNRERSDGSAVSALSLLSLAEDDDQGTTGALLGASLQSVHALTPNIVAAHTRTPALWRTTPRTQPRATGSTRARRHRVKNNGIRGEFALMQKVAEGGGRKNDDEQENTKSSVKTGKEEENEEEGTKDKDKERKEEKGEMEEKKKDEEQGNKGEAKEEDDEENKEEKEEKGEEKEKEEKKEKEKEEKKEEEEEKEDGYGKAAGTREKDGATWHIDNEKKGKMAVEKQLKTHLHLAREKAGSADTKDDTNATRKAAAPTHGAETSQLPAVVLHTIQAHVKWLEKERSTVLFDYHAIATITVTFIWLSFATYFYCTNVLKQKPRLDGPLELLEGEDYSESKLGCLEDIDSCAQACFCPFVRATDTYVSAGLLKNSPSVILHILLLFLLSWSPSAFFVFGCYFPYRHYQVRKVLNGNNGLTALLVDCLVIGCCSPCCFHLSIAQEARQVDRAVNMRTGMFFTLEECDAAVGAPVKLRQSSSSGPATVGSESASSHATAKSEPKV